LLQQPKDFFELKRVVLFLKVHLHACMLDMCDSNVRLNYPRINDSRSVCLFQCDNVAETFLAFMMLHVSGEGFLNEIPTLPETLPEAVKPRFGRRLYLVIGLVAIAVVATASIIVFTQFLPSAKGKTVPLGLNYSVGEKMTYEYNMTIEMMDTEVSQGGTLEMEVQSFDGENYTIRQTMTFGLQETSLTVKIDKMGNLVDYIGLPPELQETLSSFLGVPGFGSYFPKEEARVGESWEIPMDMELMGMDLEGTISYKLSKITSVTVPAGTYEALYLEIKPSSLAATYSVEGMSFHMDLNLDGYMYLGNATCHLIEFRINESATIISGGQTRSMEMTIQMQLIEHLK